MRKNKNLLALEEAVNKRFYIEDGVLLQKSNGLEACYTNRGQLRSLDGWGYIRIGIRHCKGTTYKGVHQIIWFLTHNEWLEYPIQLNHIDLNPLNNHINNLEKVTAEENCRNKSLYSTSKSGISGVTWVESRCKWRVTIHGDINKKYLGQYEDFFEACCVRKSAENKYRYSEKHGQIKD